MRTINTLLPRARVKNRSCNDREEMRQKSRVISTVEGFKIIARIEAVDPIRCNAGLHEGLH
jgi:hypothetical protein